MRVLLIKMSSLGDVVHALAAVNDAATARPGIVFDWAVEESYSAIPKWHPAVDRAIVTPLRRWRKSPVETLRSGEWKRFREELRRENYDVVLDAQGLLKSAFVGLQARGTLTGRNAKSAREPAAALLYKRRLQVDLQLSEVEQLRQLFAKALGYETPGGPADFGVRPERFQKARVDSYALFFHGAAWESKLWPEDRWIELGRFVRERGLNVLLPWGNEVERTRAELIAKRIGGEVLGKLEISEMARVIAHARFVVGLDTGLTHIAIALGVKTLTLYGPSVPVYDAVAGGNLRNLCSTDSRQVDTSRANTVETNAAQRVISDWV